MKKVVNGQEVECSTEEAAAIQAEWDAWMPEEPPLADWQEQRKQLYRERIADYKGRPNASHIDVLGFTMDAQMKAQAGDAAEYQDILAIINQVKAEVPAQ